LCYPGPFLNGHPQVSSMNIIRALFVGLLSLTAIGAEAQAAQKVGPEFRVNTTTARHQSEPAIASLQDHGFIVTWTHFSSDGGPPRRIYAQRYDADGQPAGGEFQASASLHGNQSWSSVAGLAGGGFVITWQEGNQSNIYGKVFGSDGTPITNEFRISKPHQQDQFSPSVAGLKEGGFVVAWNSIGSDRDIYAQRYHSDGSRAGGEFRIGVQTDHAQRDTSVAALADGGFVVVWSSVLTSSDVRIFGQRYNAVGRPIGHELQPSGAGDIANGPFVAALADGGFVTTWSSKHQGDSEFMTYARRYQANGRPVAKRFLVDKTTLDSRSPAAGLSNGGFVIAWSYLRRAPSDYEVRGKQYLPSGGPDGAKFPVNSYRKSAQNYPAVAALADGGYVVVWQSLNQDGSQEGIYGQRFAAP
jgi:hypothetical protein